VHKHTGDAVERAQSIADCGDSVLMAEEIARRHNEIRFSVSEGSNPADLSLLPGREMQIGKVQDTNGLSTVGQYLYRLFAHGKSVPFNDRGIGKHTRPSGDEPTDNVSGRH
jgi:hypothetical protein